MAVVFADWLNDNEQRAYPVSDIATRLDKAGNLLPNNVIADISIALPRSAGRYVYISSLGITDKLVSLTLLASDQGICDVNQPSSTSPSFVPIAAISIVRPVVRFKNYALSALYPGVAGWVAFGAGALNINKLSLLFADTGATQLVDRAVRAYDDIPVLSLGKLGAALKLTGIVRLQGASGIIKTFKSQRTINGVLRDVGVIGLDLSTDPVTTLQSYAGPCGHRPQAKNCNAMPITDINGVAPDRNGNITIEFEGDQVVGDAGDGLVIDFPISLSQICPKTFTLVQDTQDVCNPTSSSTTPSSSSGQPAPSSSSAGPPPTPEYCEDFESGMGEMSVKAGAFTIQTTAGTKRLVSEAGFVGEQYVIDPQRTLKLSTIGDTYVIKGTLHPRSPVGLSHLIFAYVNSLNFYFAGLSLQATPSFPHGYFYVGRRTSTGYGILAGAQFEPGVGLQIGDYRVILALSRPNLTQAEIQFKVFWAEGPLAGLKQTILQPYSLISIPGFAGLGVLNAETEFDDFGINCGGSSSSL